MGEFKDVLVYLKSIQSFFSADASFNFNQLIDNDDDNDPDFTILYNYELDENYDYMDDWFQVPSMNFNNIIN